MTEASRRNADANPFPKPFLRDVTMLREKVRQPLADGAITLACQRDVKQTIDILQTMLDTEIVGILCDTAHAIAATGISSQALKQAFAEQAREEPKDKRAVAERINQLGGKPDFNPDELATRAVSQFAEGEDLVDMIWENLLAERVAVEHCRELIQYFGEDDPTTRVMLEDILAVEEAHANHMNGL